LAADRVLSYRRLAAWLQCRCNGAGDMALLTRAPSAWWNSSTVHHSCKIKITI